MRARPVEPGALWRAKSFEQLDFRVSAREGKDSLGPRGRIPSGFWRWRCFAAWPPTTWIRPSPPMLPVKLSQEFTADLNVHPVLLVGEPDVLSFDRQAVYMRLGVERDIDIDAGLSRASLVTEGKGIEFIRLYTPSCLDVGLWLAPVLSLACVRARTFKGHLRGQTSAL